MPRISDTDLEHLKSSISIIELVSRTTGVTLKHTGRNMVGHCPFHNDKTPSLLITPSENLWHCMGACDRGGSVIDWVMVKEGVGFREAVEFLKKLYPPSSLAALPAADATARKTHRTEALPADSDDQEVLQQVVTLYHESLAQSASAMTYLKTRGLADQALIEEFQIGFSDRSLGPSLPESNRVSGARIRSQLQTLGIMRSTGHEHFRGCIVIPLITSTGNITEIYGRRISRARRGSSPHTYLQGPHRGVFNESGIKKATASGDHTLILCESFIDALSFWKNGFKNVTTSFGTNGFTEDHINALKTYKIETLLIAYDADDAGDAAAEKLATQLSSTIPSLTIKRVRFPKGMDVNEYAVRMQPAVKALGLCLEKASWFGALEQAEIEISNKKATSLSLAAQDTPRSLASKGEVQSQQAQSPQDTQLDTPRPSAQSLSLPPPDIEEHAQSAVLQKSQEPANDKQAQIPNEPPTAIEGDEVRITLGNRMWRLRGLFDNQTNTTLKVNLACYRADTNGSINTEYIYIDSLDLYLAKARQVFVRYCAEELEEDTRIIKRDMAKVLRHAETLWLRNTKDANEDEVPEMSAEEKEEALALLKDPKLIDRIIEDFAACGVVGEETNTLIGYLAAVSRKLEKPLAILIQSTSAAGKSSLMDAILRMIPQEERVQYSAMTGQSVFYMGETSLKHKVLAIAEEEGADNAFYALKMLQSEGKLSIASTGKDPKTGRLQTQEYKVEGPVMLFLTTTSIDIGEEFLNRCLVLTVDEGRLQTKAIHDAQRHSQTLEGMLEKNAQVLVTQRHQNAQRLLERVQVVNKFAKDLTFADFVTRTRRDNPKYLTLINAIALLHQHQRERKSKLDPSTGKVIDYIEVIKADIEIANRLAKAVLGRSLDAMPPQTRKLLGLIDTMAKKECERRTIDCDDYRFSRRDVREYTGWGNTQLKVHLRRLEDLEFLIVHRGSRGCSFVYALALLGEQPAEIFDYEPNLAGQKDNLAGGGRPQVGGGRGGEKSSKSTKKNGFSKTRSGLVENAHEGEKVEPVVVVVPSRGSACAS